MTRLYHAGNDRRGRGGGGDPFGGRTPSTPLGREIVKAMVGVARPLPVTVVAEGVETEAEALAARQLGCDQGQGHSWSRGWAR